MLAGHTPAAERVGKESEWLARHARLTDRFVYLFLKIRRVMCFFVDLLGGRGWIVKGGRSMETAGVFGERLALG